MFNLFSGKTNKKKEIAKKVILGELFSSANQKKIVVKAVKQSAEDQRLLVLKYNQLVK